MSAAKFFIKSGSNDFKSRQNDVFGALASFEDKVKLPKPKQHHESMEVDETTRRHKAKKNRKTTRALRGQESLFKAPGSPPLRPRCPDFRRNPHRWTKYTLADVSTEDTSERSNTAAAMEFLQSRQRTLDGDAAAAAADPTPHGILFNRTKRQTRARICDTDGDDNGGGGGEKRGGGGGAKRAAFGEASEAEVVVAPTDRPMFVNNKLVMPEYVVGGKQPKHNKLRQPRPHTPHTPHISQHQRQRLTLTHLMDNHE